MCTKCIIYNTMLKLSNLKPCNELLEYSSSILEQCGDLDASYGSVYIYFMHNIFSANVLYVRVFIEMDNTCQFTVLNYLLILAQFLTLSFCCIGFFNSKFIKWCTDKSLNLIIPRSSDSNILHIPQSAH